MKTNYGKPIMYTITFMLMVLNYFGQTRYSTTTIIIDSKSAKISSLLARENGDVPGTIKTAIKECIKRSPGFETSEIKYRLSNYEPKKGDIKFYIKFIFDEPEKSKDAVLVHLSFFDKDKGIFIPMNSYYQKWDNEPDFCTSFSELISTELGENLQYYTTKRLTQAKKTLYINPNINTALCPIPEKTRYSTFLYKFPLDIFSNIRKLNSSQYLYCLDKTKQCFEISLEPVNTNTLNPGPSKVKFNIISAQAPVKESTLDELYEMWANQRNKSFQNLCSDIFKKLGSTQGCN